MERATELVWNAYDNEAETCTVDERLQEVHVLRAWKNAHVYCDGTDVTVAQFRAAFLAEFKWFTPTACCGPCEGLAHHKDCPKAW
jgi:hypothetical protein